MGTSKAILKRDRLPYEKHNEEIYTMKNALLKLQIEGIEQQLKVLKAKIISGKEKGKRLADLYGIFERKMDLSLEEIKKNEYTLKEKS